MGAGKPTLQVIAGDRPLHVQTERTAMSFVVHERKRLDIPVSALVRVEARATKTFADQRGWPVTYDLPHVEIWLTSSPQARLRDFSRDLVGEALESSSVSDAFRSPWSARRSAPSRRLNCPRTTSPRRRRLRCARAGVRSGLWNDEVDGADILRRRCCWSFVGRAKRAHHAF